MSWNHFQDPKNPVALHKLFGSLEGHTRILDLFNSFNIIDCEGGTPHFQKVLSITPTPPPSSDLKDGLEEDEGTKSQEALLNGHITYRLEDHRYQPHIVQLFVPQVAQCEREAFFYASRTFSQEYLKDPEKASAVYAFIFTPFTIHQDFHKQPVNHHFTDTDDEGRWADAVEFTYIQLPAFTWGIEELTYDKDFWYYFFREFNNPDFHKITKKKAKVVWEALQELDAAQWTEEELNAYAQAEKAVALRQKQTPPEVELTKRNAYRLGVQRGREQAEDDQKEKEENNHTGYHILAHRMYYEGERDVGKIVKATGLAPYEVRDIIAQEERNDKHSFWQKYFDEKKEREKVREEARRNTGADDDEKEGEG